MSSPEDIPHPPASMLVHANSRALEPLPVQDYSSMLSKQTTSWSPDYPVCPSPTATTMSWIELTLPAQFTAQANPLDMPSLALFDSSNPSADFQIPSPPPYSAASTTMTLGALDDPDASPYPALFAYPQVQQRSYANSPTPGPGFQPAQASRRDSQSQLHRRSFTASPHLQPAGVPVTPSSLPESQASSTPSNKRRRADSDSAEPTIKKSTTPGVVGGASAGAGGSGQQQSNPQQQQQLVPKDEDRFLLKLKDDEKLTWKQIAERFLTDMHKTYQIPALQMRYKRLRERMRVWTDSDADALQQAHEYWELKKWDIISEKMLDFGTTEKWPARYCLNRWQQINAEKDRDALRADWFSGGPGGSMAAAAAMSVRRASADSQPTYPLQTFTPVSGGSGSYPGTGFW